MFLYPLHPEVLKGGAMVYTSAYPILGVKPIRGSWLIINREIYHLGCRFLVSVECRNDTGRKWPNLTILNQPLVGLLSFMHIVLHIEFNAKCIKNSAMYMTWNRVVHICIEQVHTVNFQSSYSLEISRRNNERV